VVADNIIYPGAPEYLKYIKSSPDWDSTTFDTFLEYSTKKDAVEVSVYKKKL
jgi:catechol O-methyltransferase